MCFNYVHCTSFEKKVLAKKYPVITKNSLLYIFVVLVNKSIPILVFQLNLIKRPRLQTTLYQDILFCFYQFTPRKA